MLHLSEHAAYGRIEAARSVRTYPVLLELLETGDITLTTISLLAPHLTPENYRRVLEGSSAQKQTRSRAPGGDAAATACVPSAIRKLPNATTIQIATPAVQASLSPTATSLLAEPSTSCATTDQRAATPEAKPAIVTPLQPHHYKVQFTVDQRHSRETSSCPGLDAAHVPERRRRRRVRASVDGVARAAGARETGPSVSTSSIAWYGGRITTYPCFGAQNCVDARQGTVCVRRHARSMHRARPAGISSCGAIRGGWYRCCGEYSTAMSRPQPVRVGPVVRRRGFSDGTRAAGLFRLARNSVWTELTWRVPSRFVRDEGRRVIHMTQSALGSGAAGS